MTKDELQGTAAHILAKNKRLMCMWATGTGKTNVALNFIKSNPWLKTLVFVPESNNIDNWKEECKKFNAPIDNVTFSCYASMHKYRKTCWDFVVFDEAPHTNTPLKRDLLSTIKGEWVLALGAVISDEEIFALQDTYGEFYKSTISLSDAITRGFVPSPTVNILHLSLDDKDKKHWYKGHVYTAKGMYDELTKKVSSCKQAFENNATSWNKTRMLSAGSERKRYLGHLKEQAIARICSYLKERKKRFLCFCSSITQAERLGKNNAFTSNTDASNQVLDRFNKHEIDSLYVVAKCIEGQNLVDIDCGVIGQIGGTDRITVQEIGRILRSEKPVVYIPVFDVTKDDGFLTTVTANIPAQCIKHYNF